MGFKAILVATDFSDCAGAAFKVAKNLARQFGAKIVLLHVIQTANRGSGSRTPESGTGQPPAGVPGGGPTAPGCISAGVLLRHLEVTSMVTVGIPFQEIAVVARDLAADLIVMGGYGRSGRGPIEEVFFGSTAEKVVRLLPCPVLCVPWESQAATAQNPL